LKGAVHKTTTCVIKSTPVKRKFKKNDKIIIKSRSMKKKTINRTLLQTTGGKNEPIIVFMLDCNTIKHHVL
jgi:hypothetical protein